MSETSNTGHCRDVGTYLEQLARALNDAGDAFQKLQSSIGPSESSEVTGWLLHAAHLSGGCVAPGFSTRPGQSSEAQLSSIPSSPEHTSRDHTDFALLECWQSRRWQLASSNQIGSAPTRQRSEEYDIRVGPAVHVPPDFLKHVIIHPDGTMRFLWDLLSLILVLYDMFLLPLQFFDIEETLFLNLMKWISRIFWSWDMVVSFTSGYMQDDGVIEMRPRRIAVKYICTWFVLDSCIVGMDWWEFLGDLGIKGAGFARLSKSSRMVRILRLLRLLRLARMKQVWELLCERFDSQTLVITLDSVKLLVIMYAIGHLVGCLFYAVGRIHYGEVNWIKVYNFSDKSTEFKYVMSLRWALSQFAGGMDEVTPTNIDESIYAGIVFFSAYWCGAIFLSVLTSSMTEFFLQGTQQRRKLAQFRNYLTINGISKKLCVRVNRNAAHAVKMKEKTEPDGVADLIFLVSESLRREIHFERYSPALRVHPFLNSYMDACPHVIHRVCHSAVSMTADSRGDVIFHAGEAAEHPSMHIVSKGSLTYSCLIREDIMVAQDDWVAEATLWVEWIYRGSLRVSEDCLMCKIDARKFQQTCSQFQHVDFDPFGYATEFVTLLNEAGEDLSDLPPKGSGHLYGFSESTKLAKTNKSLLSLISSRSKANPRHAIAVARLSQTLSAAAAQAITPHDTKMYSGRVTKLSIVPNASLRESGSVKDVTEPPRSSRSSCQKALPMKNLDRLAEEKLVVLL